MEDQYEFHISDEERAARRSQRAAAREERRRQKRRRILKNIGYGSGICAALLLVAMLCVHLFGTEPAPDEDNSAPPVTSEKPTVLAPYPDPEPDTPSFEDIPEVPFFLTADDRTITIGDELSSKHAIIIDLTGETILAQKGADVVISPASMTKILTILVAAEHIEDPSELSNTVVIDRTITDFCYVNECSVAGFLRDEEVTVLDLFYGTILPSGAEAAMGLANYIAGSQEAFVDLMNEKAAELGLAETAHFSNCIGLYSKDNVCTVYDIAMILRAAMDNELCRQILTTKIYEIAPNDAHPEGMVMSNWFLRRIEDYIPDGMEVIGAKTGYLSAAGNCAASIARTEDGAFFICVTANTSSSKQCVQDHVQLYTTYMGY